MGEQAQLSEIQFQSVLYPIEKRDILFSFQRGWSLTFTFVFLFYFHYLNMSSLLVLSGRYRIQREVVERGDKKEAVLLVLWNLCYCCFYFCIFLSYVPSEQANFKYYSLLKKERNFMLFSFLTSLPPFAWVSFLPPCHPPPFKNIISFFFLVWVWFFVFFFIYFFPSHRSGCSCGILRVRNVSVASFPVTPVILLQL